MHTKMPMMCAQFDFTGVSPWNPLSTPNPDPGPYEVVIADVDPAYNGGKSCKFTMDLPNGVTTDLYIGNEPGEKGGNKKKWRQALVAVATAGGLPEEKALAATAGQVSFDPVQTFKGKKIHILVIAVPGQDDQGRPNLPNKEFLTKAQYEAVKASGKIPTAHAPQNGATATPGATAGAQPGAATAGAPAAGGDVLKGLFG